MLLHKKRLLDSDFWVWLVRAHGWWINLIKCPGWNGIGTRIKLIYRAECDFFFPFFPTFLVIKKNKKKPWTWIAGSWTGIGKQKWENKSHIKKKFFRILCVRNCAVPGCAHDAGAQQRQCGKESSVRNSTSFVLTASLHFKLDEKSAGRWRLRWCVVWSSDCCCPFAWRQVSRHKKKKANIKSDDRWTGQCVKKSSSSYCSDSSSCQIRWC